MVGFPVTARPPDNVLRIQNRPYPLATTEQLRQLSVRRGWDVATKTAQDRPLGEPFAIHFNFHHGYGLTFAPGADGYERASGWDATAEGKLATWPQHAELESVTDTAYRGWWYYDYASGYLYLFRGRYSVKYAPDDSGSEWSILEFKTLGASGEVVAGQPAVFNGKVYVPMLTAATNALLRFYELATIATPVTEVQTIAISGTPTGGTYTLSYNDGVNTYTTAAIAYNADGPTVQAALRLLPGLQKVTVSTAGSVPNYTHTVTMTAAPTVIATASPPQMTSNAAGLTGGAPVITHGTTVAGTGDTWNRGDAAVEARYFVVWNKPTVGPVLVRANANNVSMASTTPTTAGNWSAVQPVFDSTFDVVSLATFGRLLYCGKPNMLASFDEQGQAVNEIPSISSVVDANNFVGMKEHNGWLYAPHKLGLIRWRPGSSWSIVGAEQDDTLEGERTTGWGRTIGLAPYGKYAYLTIADYFNTLGSVVSLEEQVRRVAAGTRGALTPHMHHALTIPEDIAVASLKGQQAPRVGLGTWSDDSAVGSVAWSNPSNAAADDSGYASATGSAQTHYLKGLNLGISIPSTATILGITARVKRSQLGASSPSMGSHGGGTGSGSSIGYTISADAGDKTVLIVSSSTSNAGVTTTGITFNGVAMTLIREETHSQGAFSLWRLVAPASGSNTLTVTLSGSTGLHSLTYATASGVDQTTPCGTAVGRSSNSATDPLALSGGDTIPTANGDLAIGGFFAGAVDSFTAGSGETVVQDSGSNYGAALISEPATGASVDMTPTDSQGASVPYASIGVALKKSTYSVVDTVVRLVKAGTVVGDNKADTVTDWPTVETEKVYGSSSDLWGTTWTAAEISAATFGLVISATPGGGGEARVQYAEIGIAYTVLGGSNPPSYLVVVQVSEDGATANPVAYKLPSAGMTVANDPNVPKFVTAGASFYGSRIIGPTRATPKRWSVVECYAEVASVTAGAQTPGFRIEASADDADAWHPLADAEGRSTFFDSGPLELYFPPALATSRWVQLRVVIDAVSGQQVGVSVVLRDVTLRGFLLSAPADVIKAVLVLASGAQLDDGQRTQRDAKAMRRELEALLEPGGVIEVHDPVLDRDILVVVQGIGWTEHHFNNETDSTMVCALELERVRSAVRRR